MRTLVILAVIALLCIAPSATAAPEQSSTMLEGPELVEFHSCFNGGVTIVVYGHVVAHCLGG